MLGPAGRTQSLLPRRIKEDEGRLRLETKAMKFKIAILLLTGALIGEQFASAQSRVITIYLAGDSTMAQKLPEKRPETGWGEILGSFFRDGKVIIENRAQNGRSTRTFVAE